MKRLFDSKIGLIALVVGELCYIGLMIAAFKWVVVPAVIKSLSPLPVVCWGIVAPIPIVALLWQKKKFDRESSPVQK